MALPLYSFNPEEAKKYGRFGLGRRLDQQLERLDRLTEGRLANARTIGLTVDFDFTVQAERLLRALTIAARRRAEDPD